MVQNFSPWFLISNFESVSLACAEASWQTIRYTGREKEGADDLLPLFARRLRYNNPSNERDALGPGRAVQSQFAR